MAWTIRALVGAAAAMLLAACNPIAVLDETDSEILRFHEAMGRGDEDALWRLTDERFRQATTRGQFEDMFATIRAVEGSFVSSERAGFNIRTNNGETVANVTMTSRFEQGEATEVFMWSKQGERWRLLGYHITSPQLENYHPSKEGDMPIIKVAPDAAD